MSGLLCCLRRRADMGAALSHPQEGEACDGGPPAPPTMADVIRERKKKAGGAALGTLRRRLASAARRPRHARPDRGCEHARFIRSVVASWRLVDVFLLCEELEAGAALRDLSTQAELAREPAPALHIALPPAYRDRLCCDVELVGAGWSLPAHRALLSARSSYFRDLLQRYPPSCARVPLEGACAALSRAEADACVLALYCDAPRAHCAQHAKCEGSEHAEGDLDLVDNTNTCCACTCSAARRVSRRAAALLGVTRSPLATTMRYLLDSGEMCDAKLVFRVEGGGAYGFRTALELPCHRVLLAARSRFFRSVLSRRSNSSSNGAVCVDEKVLPRRFARALLHAAYTDQVDLSLIGRSSSPPATTTPGGGAGWSGAGRAGARLSAAGLDDACQLYEIARFLEMPIVIQGCEDAIVEALTPETLPHVLRWASAPHASQWVHRQAMRYLRDEFVTITSSSGAAAIPRPALAAALASPFLQASEPAALRALLRWAADHKHRQREPNVVWHTAHSVSRRGARRRELSDASLAETLAPLVSLVRVEHIPPDSEPLQQLVRRGIVPPPPAAPAGGTALAWLGRGAARPARCFLPYLDELKALLEDQAVPEAELARARRARYMHRIPDTLYMVAAARSASPAEGAEGAEGEAGAAACARYMVGGRLSALLRARVRELRAAPNARAAAHQPRHAAAVAKQIALRAVREMSLPDACAELLLNDDDDAEQNSDGAYETPRAERRADAALDLDRQWPDRDSNSDCRTLSGSVRCDLGAPARDLADTSRSGTCRREQPARADNPHHRNSGSWGGAARLPDVALAPNANTHLLTARDYCRHAPWEYGGVVLQLDLGDGATHTPRPGSRAQRNSAAQQQSARQRDHAPVAQAMSCVRARADGDELRAALELSVIRAYSSFHGRAPPARRPAPPPAHSLPASYGGELPAPAPAPAPAPGGSPRARPRPSAPPRDPPHLALSRASPGGSPGGRRRDYPPHHDYRVEGGGFGSASTSRTHSPNNYA